MKHPKIMSVLSNSLFASLFILVLGASHLAHAMGNKPLVDDGHPADGIHYPIFFCTAVGQDRQMSYANPYHDFPSSVLIDYTSNNYYSTCGSAGISALKTCRLYDSRPESCRVKECEQAQCNWFAGDQCANPTKTLKRCP